jgi:hypothetical protein
MKTSLLQWVTTTLSVGGVKTGGKAAEKVKVGEVEVTSR